MPTSINLGKIRPVDKGEWSSEYEGGYDILDIVTYGHGSYMSKVKLNTFALTDRTKWIPLVDSAAIELAIQEAMDAAEEADGARMAIQSDLALKASHGYASSPKTLKQVDDSLVQLAGDVRHLKLNNLINNGDFSTSTGWSIGNGAAITNNELLLTGNVSFIVTQSGNYVIGHNYYFSALHYSTSDTVLSISLRNINGLISGGSLPANVAKGRRSITLTPATGTPAWLQISRSNAGTYGTITLDDIIVVDRTLAFGAGNEPTNSEMDLLISILGVDYFEGEITVTQKQIMNWQLKMIRQNRNAIVALGGTII